MTDDHAIPASAEQYRPTLPADPDLAGVEIDAAHPRFKQAASTAAKVKLSQAQFSELLAHEARSVIAARKSASPSSAPAAPAPPPPVTRGADGKIPGYSTMTMAQKLAAGGHL